MGPFRLPMLGQHNVQNALAAIAVGVEMEIDDDTLRSAFAGFRGVKRRFTKTGEAGGITVIDDYGHHPVEIAAVLKAARQAGARDVIAVVQPHRYTRLHSLFNEFCTCMNDAGTVIVADVYAAGEAPIPGVTATRWWMGLRARGHRSVVPLPGPERLAEMVYAIAKPGDFVVCLGAGNITQWAAALPASWPSCRPRARAAAARHDGRSPAIPHLVDTLPAARAAACRPDAPLAPVHLVPRRRPGRSAGAPGRRARPRRASSRALPHDDAGARARRVLQPHHPRRRPAWRGDPAGARLRRASRSKPTASSPAPPRST